MPGGYAASASGALARRHPKRALRQRFPIVQKRSLSTLFRGQGLGPNGQRLTALLVPELVHQQMHLYLIRG
jgi:hypothetical protein